MKKSRLYSFKVWIIAGGLITATSIFGGCKKSSDAPTPAPAPTTAAVTTADVLIQNTAFSANTITISVNSTVRWTNKDSYPHTVTSTANPVLFDSGQIAGGGVYSHQFTSAGTYTYHCLNHSSMTGTVIVN
jgi:plastocyanin